MSKEEKLGDIEYKYPLPTTRELFISIDKRGTYCFHCRSNHPIFNHEVSIYHDPKYDFISVTLAIIDNYKPKRFTKRVSDYTGTIPASDYLEVGRFIYSDEDSEDGVAIFYLTQ